MRDKEVSGLAWKSAAAGGTLTITTNILLLQFIQENKKEAYQNPKEAAPRAHKIQVYPSVQVLDCDRHGTALPSSETLSLD